MSQFLQRLGKSKALLAIVLVAGFHSIAHASLITNGSFEQTVGKNLPNSWSIFNNDQLVGWSTTRNFELWRSGKVAGRTPSSEGSYLLELNAHHRGGNDPYAIYQTFDSQIGAWYNVAFDYRGRRNAKNGFDFLVSSGGQESFLSLLSSSSISQPLLSQTTSVFSVNEWQTTNLRFQATTQQTTLGFVSLSRGTTGNLLDNVSVNTVSTVDSANAVDATAGLGAILAAAGFIFLRRRTRNT